MDVPHSGFNRAGLLRNGDEELVVGEHWLLLIFAILLNATKTKRKPVGQCEVHCLVEVELAGLK
jgi:hypothetical protein